MPSIHPSSFLFLRVAQRLRVLRGESSFLMRADFSFGHKKGRHKYLPFKLRQRRHLLSIN
jgi:hypothetical protein